MSLNNTSSPSTFSSSHYPTSLFLLLFFLFLLFVPFIFPSPPFPPPTYFMLSFLFQTHLIFLSFIFLSRAVRLGPGRVRACLLLCGPRQDGRLGSKWPKGRKGTTLVLIASRPLRGSEGHLRGDENRCRYFLWCEVHHEFEFVCDCSCVYWIC